MISRYAVMALVAACSTVLASPAVTSGSAAAPAAAAVWRPGGQPAPPWFGVCPSGALPLRRSDLPGARAAVMWFVRVLYPDLNGGDVDVRGARAVRMALGTETVRGGYARIKCGRGMRKRTAVVFVQLPAMAPSASLSSAVFYASRTSRGWVVWFQIH
jgi:hypothetical protein